MDRNSGLHIVIASKNPVKQAAVEQGFAAVFPELACSFEAVLSNSGVSDQPLSDEETLRGALNRVVDIRRQKPHADFYIGIEGGVEDREGELHEFAWAVVEDFSGKIGKGRSAVFIAPPEIRRLILDEGKELGDAGDIVFKQENCKQKTGVIGLLTNGAIDRVELYRHPMIIALTPFVHPELYS